MSDPLDDFIQWYARKTHDPVQRPEGQDEFVDRQSRLPDRRRAHREATEERRREYEAELARAADTAAMHREMEGRGTTYTTSGVPRALARDIVDAPFASEEAEMLDELEKVYGHRIRMGQAHIDAGGRGVEQAVRDVYNREARVVPEAHRTDITAARRAAARLRGSENRRNRAHEPRGYEANIFEPPGEGEVQGSYVPGDFTTYHIIPPIPPGDVSEYPDPADFARAREHYLDQLAHNRGVTRTGDEDIRNAIASRALESLENQHKSALTGDDRHNYQWTANEGIQAHTGGAMHDAEMLRDPEGERVIRMSRPTPPRHELDEVEIMRDAMLRNPRYRL